MSECRCDNSHQSHPSFVVHWRPFRMAPWATKPTDLTYCHSARLSGLHELRHAYKIYVYVHDSQITHFLPWLSKSSFSINQHYIVRNCEQRQTWHLRTRPETNTPKLLASATSRRLWEPRSGQWIAPFTDALE